jgi:hypothetical protein
MQVITLNELQDGGSLVIQTDQGLFVVDNKLATTTAGRVFKGYPQKDKSNMIKDLKILLDLKEAVQESSSSNYSKFVFVTQNR